MAAPVPIPAHGQTSPLPPDPPELAAVLRMAARGWRLFPVEPRGKVPLIKEWPENATCDAAVLRAWSQKYSGCNWGLATGAATGVWVLDVDGEQGEASIRALSEQHGSNGWNETLAVKTARGRHFYYSWPGGVGVRNSAGKVAPGLDVRGHGGYVIVPTSIHPSGAIYHWVGDREAAPIAPAPSWLLEMLAAPAVKLGPAPAAGANIILEGGRNAALASLAGTMRRKEMSPEAIEAALLIENASRCKPPLRDTEVLRIARSVARYAPSAGIAGNPLVASQTVHDDWPDLAPLGGELPPVPSFDLQLLPELLRPLVEDTAERMQVPPDFPAAVAVLCLAGATNRRATIQPKAVDQTFIVVPNLWGGIVAPPGMMKSPVITAITRPLAKIEADWRSEYDEAVRHFEQEREEAELEHQAWRELYKSAQKSGKALPDRSAKPPVPPVANRLITQDSTAEKLHELMRDNPAGILVIRDELTGWLATLDKPGREGERAFYLSAWNGDTSYTMDRIGRGTIYVPGCCASILGGIQPARLRAYLDDTLRDGPKNDGLLQRFQVLVYPDIPKDWRLVDRAPNQTAITDAAQVYCRLVRLEVDSRPAFRFSGDAQQLSNEWLTDLETTKLRGADLHPALVGHLAKYRSLMPSLALLFELADGGTEIVSLQHAKQAAALCDYLESHARRIYSMIISPEREAAAELGRHLAAGWKRTEGMFTVRDVYQNDWRALTTPDAVRRALPILEDAGWVRPAEMDGAKGRPSELFLINPEVARRPK